MFVADRSNNRVQIFDRDIPGTRPEGMAADEQGNIFGGLTAGCETSRSGGCRQKFVKR